MEGNQNTWESFTRQKTSCLLPPLKGESKGYSGFFKPSRSLEGQIHRSLAPGGQEYRLPFGPKCSWPQLKEQSQHIPRSLLAAENAPGRGNGLPRTSRPSLEIAQPSIIPSQARPYKVGKVAAAIWKGAMHGQRAWQGQLLGKDRGSDPPNTTWPLFPTRSHCKPTAWTF